MHFGWPQLLVNWGHVHSYNAFGLLFLFFLLDILNQGFDNLVFELLRSLMRWWGGLVCLFGSIHERLSCLVDKFLVMLRLS